jgi:Acetamidase/Formamidase family
MGHPVVFLSWHEQEREPYRRRRECPAQHDRAPGNTRLQPSQAYAICSVAVDLRISQTVDVPNPLVSALLPLDIFI